MTPQEPRNYDLKGFVPDVEGFDKIISIFDKALDYYPEALTNTVGDISALDMDEGNTFCPNNGSHYCGSPACHGGWYLRGVLLNKLTDSERSVIERYERLPEKGRSANLEYTLGSDLMDLHLGADSRAWAKHNPRLWGNTRGGAMFSNNIAFGVMAYETLSLTGIRDHWAEVRNRCWPELTPCGKYVPVEDLLIMVEGPLDLLKLSEAIGFTPPDHEDADLIQSVIKRCASSLDYPTICRRYAVDVERFFVWQVQHTIAKLEPLLSKTISYNEACRRFS